MPHGPSALGWEVGRSSSRSIVEQFPGRQSLAVQSRNTHAPRRCPSYAGKVYFGGEQEQGRKRGGPCDSPHNDQGRIGPREPLATLSLLSALRALLALGDAEPRNPHAVSPRRTGPWAGPSVEPVAHMHRITSSQYANSVRDLLGSGAPIGPLDPDQLTDGFASIGSSSIVSSASATGLYEAAANAAAAWVFADPTRATAALACVPTTATDTTCASQAISALGQRAYRRPLTTDETNRLVTLATTMAGQPGGTITIGMQYAVSTILQSPNFLYRVELGAPSAADGGRTKYNSYEMASRLASTLWNTVPDSMLLDAAGKDSLSTANSVKAEAQRMMADPHPQPGRAAVGADLDAPRNHH